MYGKAKGGKTKKKKKNNSGSTKTIKKDKKSLWTFASFEENDELFSDRNVFPIGCVRKMERILL